MGETFVGTSGFASPLFRSALAAPSGAAPDLLSSYGSRFNSVELDSVFYRRPSEATVRGWVEATDPGFRFAVRVPRELTHVDRLGMPARVGRFACSLSSLQERLGCLLFTTPATFHCDLHRFQHVLEALPEGLRTAWEFRNPSWHRPEVLELLAEHGSGPVVVDHEDAVCNADLLPPGAELERFDLPFLYVRFRKERYQPGGLIAWGELLSRVVAEGRGVHAYFRQSQEATAYVTALAELLAEAKPEIASAAESVLTASEGTAAGHFTGAEFSQREVTSPAGAAGLARPAASVDAGRAWFGSTSVPPGPAPGG